MKISKIKTNGRSKKQKSIFSIDLFGDNLVSSSIAGDIAIYDGSGAVLKAFKKHSCSALCVRFSPDGKNICVSYDDGNVVIYNREGEIKYSYKSHSGDVSGLVYTDSFLVSVGYDGVVVFYQLDGSKIVKKMKVHDEKITGVAYSKVNKLLVTQGSDALVLFSGTTIIKKFTPPPGVVLENFFSRMDWSGDGKLLACGLMFNYKANSVEIFDKDLTPMYSLIGHVAPIEVVAFNPNTYFLDKPYHIVVLASQDLSISLWNTLKPFPFLLLKNVADMPILDMKWNEKGNVLYFCSYDGLINKLEFDENELGDVSRRETPAEDNELFLTAENIKLHTVAQNKDLEKKITKIKMGNKKKPKEEDKADSPIGKKKLNVPIAKTVAQIEETDTKKENVKQNLEKEEMKTTNDVVMKNKEEIKIEKRQRRRVVPTLLDDKTTFGSDSLFIFNYKKPTLDCAPAEIFSKQFGDYKIDLNKERTCLGVSRDEKHFYKVYGEIKAVCCSKKDLCVYSDVLRLIDLRTGNLLFPSIGTLDIFFIDVWRDNILYLEVDGRLSVVDVKKQRTLNYSIPSSGELLSISFDRHYYILCKFKKAEYFLNRKSGMWYLKKKEWNTIGATDTDYTNTIDETINKLENDFLVYKSVKKYHKMKLVVKKFIKKVVVTNNIQEVVENKMRRFLMDLNNLGQSKFVHKILGRLNKKFNLQYFIADLLKEIRK